jgi:hypothetical protein
VKKNFRAILHNCYHHGFEAEAARAHKESAPRMVSWLQGKINYFAQVDPRTARRFKQVYELALERHQPLAGKASVKFAHGKRAA